MSPIEIEQRILDVSHDDMELIEKYRQILEMIEWLHISFQKSSKNTEAFRKTLLFYFWDEGCQNYIATLNLARLSKGNMIGVQYNNTATWVGGSLGYFVCE